MLHHGSVGRVHVRNATLGLHLLFWDFFFHQKVCVFIIFISFFGLSIKFLQQNISQSETGIGDTKL